MSKLIRTAAIAVIAPLLAIGMVVGLAGTASATTYVYYGHTGKKEYVRFVWSHSAAMKGYELGTATYIPRGSGRSGCKYNKTIDLEKLVGGSWTRVGRKTATCGAPSNDKNWGHRHSGTFRLVIWGNGDAGRVWGQGPYYYN